MAYTTYEGNLDAKGLIVGLVVSRFNNLLTDKLRDGALDCLRRHGGAEKDVSVAYVPGAFEISYAASRMLKTGKFDAIVCLGAVIRGDTPHFDYIATEASRSIARLALDSGVPVVYGLVTADTLDQAIERAGTKAGNKGWDAAESAIELVNLYRSIG
ncbi:MAG TPA: 6,7-dimethyl-8-ribityllumazine synthase [Acidobacteriota bacterium]|nr:6,7-dimethyl-8-ribityllumazine synthase [Acidobacteriota bacterium]